MPKIWNENLFQRFQDYLRTKVGDSIDVNSLANIVPTVNADLPPRVFLVRLQSTDNDQILTVPEATMWKIRAIMVSYTASASAGNRIIEISLRSAEPAAGPITFWLLRALNVQVASTTESYFAFPGGSNVSEDVVGHHILPLPPEISMPEGFLIRVRDSANISGNDTFNLRVLVEEIGI